MLVDVVDDPLQWSRCEAAFVDYLRSWRGAVLPQQMYRQRRAAAPVTKTERFRLPSAPLPEKAKRYFASLSALVGALRQMQPRPTRTAQSASGAKLLSEHVRCCGCVVKLIIPQSE
jgi:hypothetical protein